MDYLGHLPSNVTALITRINQKFGTPPRGWRYPTYADVMERDEALQAQCEISAWFRKLEADGWKINGIPISALD